MNTDIRHYDKIADEAFVMATWIKGYRDSSAVRAVPSPIYLIGQRHRIMRILNKASTRITVACDPETPELIYGYAVWTGEDILHWVYVKSTYRRLGVAKRLLEGKDTTPVLYTHRSPLIEVEELLRDKYINMVYNPYLLEELE